MARTVGYACNLKRHWINRAVQLLGEGLNEEEYKAALNEYLSYEIDGPTRLRKTREILMNIWYYADETLDPIRKEALALLEKYPEYDAALYLCMLYLAYPVVADIGKFMGRLFEFQDEVTNTALRQKLYDEWGERASLEATVRRVSLTLKDLGLLDCTSRTRYVVNKMSVTKDEVVKFLVNAAMKIDGDSYYSFSELNDFSTMFPFDYKVSKECILLDDRFMVTSFGGELSVGLK